MPDPLTIQSALATHFPAALRLPLDVVLGLYGGTATKTHGLTLTTKKRTRNYPGKVGDIFAGQSAFRPSGYSMSADSLNAVAGFVRTAGNTCVL